jgi:glutathione S-transferase
MLRLYHNDMSTCAQKVRIALAEKHLAWESVHLTLRDGDQFDPDYLKLNPKGVVPTLIHDDIVVRESQVILEYLEDAFPEPSLRPPDAAGRARMRLWTKQPDEDIHPSTAMVSVAIAFRHQYLQKSPQEMQAYRDKAKHVSAAPAYAEHMRTLIQDGVAAPAFVGAIKRYDRLFSDMEIALNQGPWLAGETYSLADISYTPYMTRFEHLHLLGMLAKRPRLQDWYERVKARDSYQEAFTKWENPAYFEIYRTKAPAEWPRVEEILQEQ